MYMKLGLFKAHKSSPAFPLISRSIPHAVFQLWSFGFKLGSLYQGDQGYIRALEGDGFSFLQNKYSSLVFNGADPEEQLLSWCSDTLDSSSTSVAE